MDEVEEFRFLYETCSQLIKAQENEELFPRIIQNLCTAFKAVASSLWVSNSQNGFGFRRIAYHQASQEIKSFLPTLDFKIANLAAKKKQGFICYNLKLDRNFQEVEENLKITSILLITKSEFIGVINIWCKYKLEQASCCNHNYCNNSILLQKLTNDFTSAIYNYKYYSNSRQQRLNRELEFARKMQTDLVPKSIPKIRGISVAARNMMANEVGGDYVDLFLTQKNNLGIAIGDVMGKGIPAALWTTVARATLRVAARDDLLPHLVISEVNQTLYEDLSQQDMFLTLLYAWYEPVKQTLVFANAGHYSPVLIQSTSGEHKVLKLNGPYIGGKANYEFRSNAIKLNQGDVLIFYTDGLIEAVNAQNEQFGLNNLIDVVVKNSFYKAPEILDNLWLHIGQHIGSYHQLDDLSCIVFKVDDLNGGA